MIQFRGIDPRLRAHAEATVSYAHRLGVYPTITSVRRTWSEQAKLYQAFQAGKRRYPAAPPGASAHQYGVAWDSSVPASQMPLWTAIRRAMGWRVPDNDIVHAEVGGWESYRGRLSRS